MNEMAKKIALKKVKKCKDEKIVPSISSANFEKVSNIRSEYLWSVKRTYKCL